MRIVIVISLVCIMQSFALESFTQNSKISLSVKEMKLEDIMMRIEDQTKYRFAYNKTEIDVDKSYSVNINNVDIKELLDKLFLNRDICYNIIDRQIVLSSSKKKSISQQQKIVSGRVVDITGSGLPGVSVVVKGTTTGVITDMDGKYILAKVPENATLQFSFVGMKTQEVKVGTQNTINIVLLEESVGIEEVVAIGYGTVRKKDLTGSVSSVAGSTLKDIPVTSAAQAIVGRMAGVQVTKTEGSPDADIKIRIRGGGSITQDNSPLYIVDGFPVDNINDIAPTDITSMDILKDASSTAIYGARGANGVILITTKGGTESKGKISYNSYFGLKKITKYLDVLNPYEFVYWQYELQPNTLTSSPLERYFGDFNDFDLYKQMHGTNWQDQIFGKTGTSMYHNLSFSGGSSTSKYNISLTKNDEEEIMIGSGYSRTNLVIKTFHKINDWLNIDLNTRLSDNNLKGAGTSSNNRLSHAVQYRPINGLSDYVDNSLDDGDYEAYSSFILNPVDQTNDDYSRTKSLSFNFNGAATFRISENLNYRFEYGTQYGEIVNKRFYGIHTSNTINYGTQPLASIISTNFKSSRLANVLTYSKRDFLPGSNLIAMIGEELNYSHSFINTSSAKYFPKYIDPVSALSMMQLGTPDPIVTADNPANKISSFFGRINYDYNGKYLASATLRADGSSKFDVGNQWGYFPSVALAWRISDEKFISSVKNWLSDLKLRTSFGESGNNRIPDNAWQKTFNVSSEGLFLEGNESTPSSYLVPKTVLSNPKLKWETTITRNVGFDFGILKQRISGSIEIYKNTTKDLLISATIPSSTGYTTQWQNIGQTSNKGLEIVLNGVIIEQKDFRLSASFNIGFNKNRIDRLGDTKSWEQTSNWYGSVDGPTGDYLIKEGGQIGLIYGYETVGMYTFDDFNYSNGSYTLKDGVSDNKSLTAPKRFWPGTLKLKDQNGDLLVDATHDKVVIGNANPKNTGGFNLTTQYKDLDLSIFFNWVYGNNIYNANKLAFTTYGSGRYYKNILNIMNSDNRFTYIDKTTGEEVSDPIRLAEMNKNATIWSAANSLVPLHSWGIENGSFLRLNNITLGYSLPKTLLNKFNVRQFRLYTTAYNLWTWTKYSGYDPEVDTQSSTPLTPGIDWSAYPRSRSFIVGLNVEF